MLNLPLRLFVICALALGMLAHAQAASAHPLPISSIDLEYGEAGLEGRVTVHMRDLAPAIGVLSADDSLDPALFYEREERIHQHLASQLRFGDAPPRWTGMGLASGDNEALSLSFAVPSRPPPALSIEASLFSHISGHQTFLNVYEDGDLRQQWLLGADADPVTYYSGSRSGLLAVVRHFVPSGVYHILIGPDHVLFLIGLLLTGGTVRRLVMIVTAFTIGHSVTLSLAALNLVNLPPEIVEPAIALTIVLVGVDNFMRRQGRDIRVLMALVFGLIHGFGFAFVLREVGLPQGNLTAALFSFNLGVELGQIAIVLIVAPLLALLRRRSETAARRVCVGGSLAVAAAGAYWFVDRVLSAGRL
jgi:hydrogenase/urease accessory protein HupE